MASGKKAKESRAPRSIQNRRARFDYAIEDEYEAGIVLAGSEVKSIYEGRASLTDSYARVVNDEIWLLNMDVEPYEKTSHFGHERRRDRKLLMHRREIAVMERKSLEKGLSIIPISVYFNDKGRVKVRLGLGRGKARYDKREQVAKDDARREVERLRSNRE